MLPVCAPFSLGVLKNGPAYGGTFQVGYTVCLRKDDPLEAKEKRPAACERVFLEDVQGVSLCRETGLGVFEMSATGDLVILWWSFDWL
ncbi:hypothetical protein KM043_010935 [Ampulex compressa]|nr:hypothetical protein KM043_010935 [Ampulex compressa]